MTVNSNVFRLLSILYSLFICLQADLKPAEVESKFCYIYFIPLSIFKMLPKNFRDLGRSHTDSTFSSRNVARDTVAVQNHGVRAHQMKYCFKTFRNAL